MQEDLDHILLDQYHVSKHLGHKMVKVRKLIGDDPLLLQFQELNKKRTQFFEDMIENKTILNKKKRKTKRKSDDFLAKHPLVEIYKYAWMSTFYGYNVMIESFKGFMTMYKKDR